MNCPKCGAFNPDGAPNCSVCGEPFAPMVDPYAVPNIQPIDPGPAPEPKKMDSKKIIAIAVAAVILIAAIVGAAITIKIVTSRVKADDFIGAGEKAVSFEGYNGYGTISYEPEDLINYYDIYDELGGEPFGSFTAKKYTNGDMKESNLNKAEKYVNAFDIEFDKVDGLSNGDTVTLTIKINYDKINDNFEFKNKLVGEEKYTKEFTVSGLDEIQAIDPFELISSVSYDSTGYSDYVDIVYGATSKDYGDFSVEIDDYYDDLIIYGADGYRIATYDIVIDYDSLTTSSVELYLDDYWSDVAIGDLEDCGCVLTQTTKTFTPDTITYLSKGDSLSQTDFNTLKAMADDEATSRWNNVQFVGAYFGYDPDWDDNTIIFAYSYYDDWYNETYYAAVYYENLKVDSNNTVVNIDSLYTYTDSFNETLTELESGYSSYDQFNSIQVN